MATNLFFIDFNVFIYFVNLIKFYFTLKKKVLFVLKIINFCSDFFGLAGKWFDKKAKVNFKIYDVTAWETNNYNTHIAHYQPMKL